jgi:uncharacterized peroxidase-related enzyme
MPVERQSIEMRGNRPRHRASRTPSGVPHMSSPNRFPLHTSRSAPAASQAALAATERALGFLPNLFATMSESPETLRGYLALEDVLAHGTFTSAERQLVLVATSTANGCAYCAAAHSTLAGAFHASADALAAARGSVHADDTHTDALIAFTHTATRERGHVEPEALERFLAAGFTAAQAMEVVANIGLKTISNYIDGFAHVPLDAAFAAQRWEAPLDSPVAA